jgi:hypothetical protein
MIQFFDALLKARKANRSSWTGLTHHRQAVTLTASSIRRSAHHEYSKSQCVRIVVLGNCGKSNLT